MIEVKEVLRSWLEGAGLRTVAERAVVDDPLVGAVVAAVRPDPGRHGASWEVLLAHEEAIRPGWSGTARTPSAHVQ